jgi:hypothetical protein
MYLLTKIVVGANALVSQHFSPNVVSTHVPISSTGIATAATIHIQLRDSDGDKTTASSGSSQSDAAAASGPPDSPGPEDSKPENYDKVVMAHAILGGISFVVLFPLGAIFLRLVNVSGFVLIHAAIQLFALSIAIVVLGLGIWMANSSDQLDLAHPILGIVVIGCLLLQPLTGAAHHLLYRRDGHRRKLLAVPHVWWGRAFVTVGIINGGLGLQLSGNTTKGIIAYGVVAGVVWIAWVLVFVKGYTKNKKPRTGSQEKSLEAQAN